MLQIHSWYCPWLLGFGRKKAAFSEVALQQVCGLEPTADQRLDGEALAEVLLGKEARSRAAALCWRRPPDRKYAYGAGPLPDLAVREGDWKLLCDFDGSQPWLYHLKEDPGETINRAAQEPEMVETWMKPPTEKQFHKSKAGSCVHPARQR